VVFLSKTQFSQEIVFNLVEKTKQEYVLPKLIDSISTTCIFNLWMSKGGHDIFVSVINFLGYD
jgi:hypothetical protein